MFCFMTYMYIIYRGTLQFIIHTRTIQESKRAVINNFFRYKLGLFFSNIASSSSLLEGIVKEVFVKGCGNGP